MTQLLRPLALACVLVASTAFPALAVNDISGTNWNETDGSNTAASPNGFATGMIPSNLEPTGRMLMGAMKRFWDRDNPVTSTTGSAGAYVLTLSVAPDSYVQGERFCAKANFTALGSDTLNVNGLGAVGLYALGPAGLSPIAAGTIMSGAMFCGAYDSALNTGGGGFQLISPLATSGSFDNVTGIGIGMTHVNPLDITLTQNAASLGVILNTSTGSAAVAGWRASNGTHATTFSMLGTGFTPGSGLLADGALFRSTGVGGIAIATTNAAGTIRIVTVGGVMWTFDAAGRLLAGYSTDQGGGQAFQLQGAALFSGNASIGGNASITGNASVGGTFSVTGAPTFTVPVPTTGGGTGASSLAGANIVTDSTAASSTANHVPKYADTTGNSIIDGYEVGTSANDLVQLDGSGKLPAVDGSQLTNLPVGNWAGTAVTVKTSSGTVTIPSGATKMHVKMVGGGGGGGDQLSHTAGNGGGGAGAYCEQWFTGLTAGNTVTATVGAAGTHVSFSNGNAGGQSKIVSGTQTITTQSANGGNFGIGGGAGGAAQSTSSGCSFTIAGAPGSSAGPAGSSRLGSGGFDAGVSASGYGAGGAAASGADAGDGSAGLIIFEWFQ